MTKSLRLRAKKIKLLLFDIDGVLTDGRIYYLPAPRGGFVETKGFNSRDGLGIRIAHQSGLKTGVISGRGGPIVEHRLKELGINYIHLNHLEKLEVYKAMLKAAQVKDAEVCYMGDDLVDLPILRRAGLAIGVADGHPMLRKHVHHLTRNGGGAGAVREVIELILTAQDKFAAVMKHYLR